MTSIKGSGGIVRIDGDILNPAYSQTFVNHSPDGFAWGYGGSGPSQLALALLLEYGDKEFALSHYQTFKFDVIASLPSEFEIDETIVTNWIEANKDKLDE